MLILNATQANIIAALTQANTQFDDNIKFKRFTVASTTRAGTSKYTVTLTVRTTTGPGARRAPHTNRRIAAACWHAHRAFLDALPPQAEVLISDRTYPTPGSLKPSMFRWHPGDPHHDWNIGSQRYPCLMSEACECDQSGDDDSPASLYDFGPGHDDYADRQAATA